MSRRTYTKFAVITPSDTADPAPFPVNGIYVDGIGSLAVMDDSGDVVTLEAVLVGAVLPIAPRRVMAATTGGPFIALG